MNWNLMFFVNSVLLGVGLAMDAFSVSLANGLNEPLMKRGRMSLIAGVFAVFQAAMPMIGWRCVHTIAQYFQAFERMIPWIALILLLYIGGKMLMEGIKGNEEECETLSLGFATLMVQGIATSIDALSVGLAISEYSWIMAFVCSVIIAVVTFFICISGLQIGKIMGTRLTGKANVLGGVILICIGLEIFIKGVFFG
ncbi:MAG: manganese efflux pump MntP family protein [Acetatifactor sp.]|nr:manganese efflux pump MntP family protein [Acetatifactor sp.]